MARRSLKYAVSFEPWTAPVKTVTGEVSASTTQAGARLAMKAAMSQAPGQHWKSLVIVLEKMQDEDGD
jgi:hypothetical protein